MTIKTKHDADTLEARDTTVSPLVFSGYGAYDVGDAVTVTSSDGAVFIGHVEDIEEDGKIYVELD